MEKDTSSPKLTSTTSAKNSLQETDLNPKFFGSMVPLVWERVNLLKAWHLALTGKTLDTNGGTDTAEQKILLLTTLEEAILNLTNCLDSWTNILLTWKLKEEHDGSDLKESSLLLLETLKKLTLVYT